MTQPFTEAEIMYRWESKAKLPSGAVIVSVTDPEAERRSTVPIAPGVELTAAAAVIAEHWGEEIRGTGIPAGSRIGGATEEAVRPNRQQRRAARKS